MGKALKIISGMVATVLLLSFILTVFRVMSWRLFWLIAIVAGAFAYFGLPRMKKS